MLKRERIEVSEDFSEFEILGIHSTLGITSLAWTLDKLFSTSFWITQEPVRIISHKQNSDHVCFCNIAEQNESETEGFLTENTMIWLVENQGSTDFLHSVRPKPDFFIVSKGETNPDWISTWANKLKKIQGIEMSYPLSGTVKQKMKWIFWLPVEEGPMEA